MSCHPGEGRDPPADDFQAKPGAGFDANRYARNALIADFQASLVNCTSSAVWASEM